MSEIQGLSCTQGDFSYEEGTFRFAISDLTRAAAELGVTERMFGYILAALDEYGAEVSFGNNTYNCELKYYGKHGALEKTDYICTFSFETDIDLLAELDENYRYYFNDGVGYEYNLELDGFYTNRGIRLRDSLDSVIFAYGIGNEGTITHDDILYQAMATNEDSNLYILDKCVKYVAYTYEDKGNIVFYFDKNNRLTLIMYCNIVTY